MYHQEKKLSAEGRMHIAGIDEAGRGPLAGPVVAAAVILPKNHTIEGINDSKKLTAKKREKLYHEILAYAQVGVGIVNEKIIDAINIYEATRLAMKHAVLDLAQRPEYLLIDGTMTIELPIQSMSIINGDAQCASIAAASIIAKVTRDELMCKLHIRYPQYAFNKHKGYPTKEHVALLSSFGVSPVHRLSFRPVRNVNLQNTPETDRKINKTVKRVR
ncbi:MAG: ribonuclease HII [Candidatus Omnitrophica bacterium]|nr:ribonuclease HII [Candidatus Omnitrophota bacterium]